MRPASATIPAFMPDLTDPDVQQVLADLTASLALAETRAQKIRQAHGAGQTSPPSTFSQEPAERAAKAG